MAVDWFSSPDRIHRKALGLRWLTKLVPPGTIPSLVFEDPARHLLAMQAIPSPHANWKTMLLRGQIDPATLRQFGKLLGMIHRRAHEQRAALATALTDRSFFGSLRLDPCYEFSTARVPEAAGFLQALIDESRRRRDTLVHGDHSHRNILLQDRRLILLDHEVVHWGDPAFDLGFSLSHLLSKAHHLPEHRRQFEHAAHQYWQTHHQTLGRSPWAADLEGRVVCHAIGCLLAGVAGRSTLEYLDRTEQVRQRIATVRLIAAAPATVDRLVEDFLSCL